VMTTVEAIEVNEGNRCVEFEDSSMENIRWSDFLYAVLQASHFDHHERQYDLCLTL
jgi:hypothetical protein